MSTQIEAVDVAIIGGGITGLAAAYELAQRQIGFVLLEAARSFGGTVQTEHIHGFTIDSGPDALLAQKPAAIDLCREIGLGDRLVPMSACGAYVLFRGRLHPLPEGAVVGIPTGARALWNSHLFSFPGKVRMAADVILPRRPLGADEDESIGSFIGRRFGREAVERLAEPLLAGIHAGDVDRLSMRALFPRFVEAEQRYGSVIRAFRVMRRRAASAQPSSGDPPEASLGGSRTGHAGQSASPPMFYSLAGGIGELAETLVALLSGPALRSGSPVTRVERDGDLFSIATAAGPRVHARAVIFATPAYVTATLLGTIDSSLASLIAAIRYTSTATIFLAYPREAVGHPLDGSGFVVPRQESDALLAATWVSSKWPHRAPPGAVLLRAFVGGARDEARLEQSDEELVRAARAALAGPLHTTGDPMLTRVYRWRQATAQHEVGHLAQLRAIEQRLERHPGLFLTGSGFRGVGIPDCIADGRAVARAAAALRRGA